MKLRMRNGTGQEVGDHNTASLGTMDHCRRLHRDRCPGDIQVAPLTAPCAVRSKKELCPESSYFTQTPLI